MKILLYIYLIMVLPFVALKGWHAWRRGRNAYKQDAVQHASLREYLLGNGATDWQARSPFLRHALQRAFIPIARQWRLWLVIIGIGILLILLSKY
jgi:hypothetical protein